jgi:hypothetical protein
MLSHPNVHPAWSQWSEDQTLHLVAVYSNPLRFVNRRQTFQNFIVAMTRTPNVKLYVVEVAYGDRPLEMMLKETGDYTHVPLRSKDMIWVKENAINIGVRCFPSDWKYGGYSDGDFTYTRHDWALEAIHQLQHYDFVQLYSSYAFLSRDHRPMQLNPSFAFAYHQYFGGKLKNHSGGEKMSASGENLKITENPYRSSALFDDFISNIWPGSTGGAWAWTKEAFTAVGGLLDRCVLGAADWYMAFGLMGNFEAQHPELMNCGSPYVSYIKRWQTRAYDKIKGNIGYVNNHAAHQWHGDLKNRGYGTRWKILVNHDYSPDVDVKYDWQGLLTWSGDKPKFRDEVNRYFISRDEDDTTTYKKPMV